MRRAPFGIALASFDSRMPSVLHEALRELFAKRPALFAPLLQSALEMPIPSLIAVDSELSEAR